MSAGARRSGPRVALALAVLAFAPACHRKAPGPEECREFAYQAIGVRSEADLRIPGALKQVDELTTQCLLTPFDRELLACVEQGLAARVCLRDFDLRHPASTPVSPLRPERRPREVPFP
jgi:hypothetical protein